MRTRLCFEISQERPDAGRPSDVYAGAAPNRKVGFFIWQFFAKRIRINGAYIICVHTHTTIWFLSGNTLDWISFQSILIRREYVFFLLLILLRLHLSFILFSIHEVWVKKGFCFNSEILQISISDETTPNLIVDDLFGVSCQKW